MSNKKTLLENYFSKKKVHEDGEMASLDNVVSQTDVTPGTIQASISPTTPEELFNKAKKKSNKDQKKKLDDLAFNFMDMGGNIHSSLAESFHKELKEFIKKEKINVSESFNPKKGDSVIDVDNDLCEVILVGSYDTVSKEYAEYISDDLAKIVEKGEIDKNDDFLVLEAPSGIKVYLASDLEVMNTSEEKKKEKVTVEEYEEGQWGVYGEDGVLIEDGFEDKDSAITWANEKDYDTDSAFITENKIIDTGSPIEYFCDYYKCDESDLEDGWVDDVVKRKAKIANLIYQQNKPEVELRDVNAKKSYLGHYHIYDIDGIKVLQHLGQPDSMWWKKDDEEKLLKLADPDNLDEAMIPGKLVKGKVYNWTMGAEPLDVKYIGMTIDNPDIKVGSSVGKGYIFQWVEDGKYFEIGRSTISDYVELKEEDKEEEPIEGDYFLVIDNKIKKKYNGYNIDASDREKYGMQSMFKDGSDKKHLIKQDPHDLEDGIYHRMVLTNDLGLTLKELSESKEDKKTVYNELEKIDWEKLKAIHVTKSFITSLFEMGKDSILEYHHTLGSLLGGEDKPFTDELAKLMNIIADFSQGKIEMGDKGEIYQEKNKELLRKKVESLPRVDDSDKNAFSKLLRAEVNEKGKEFNFCGNLATVTKITNDRIYAVWHGWRGDRVIVLKDKEEPKQGILKTGTKIDKDGYYHEKIQESSDKEEKAKITSKTGDWYLTKCDSTHVFLSNNPDSKGSPYHIGQLRNEPFYKDLESWLHGGASIDGKIYESDSSDKKKVSSVDKEENKELLIDLLKQVQTYLYNDQFPEESFKEIMSKHGLKPSRVPMDKRVSELTPSKIKSIIKDLIKNFNAWMKKEGYDGDFEAPRLGSLGWAYKGGTAWAKGRDVLNESKKDTPATGDPDTDPYYYSRVYKVKIIKCSDPKHWYKDKIGEEFEVTQCMAENIAYQKEYDGLWECVKNRGSLGIFGGNKKDKLMISKLDAKVIELPEGLNESLDSINIEDEDAVKLIIDKLHQLSITFESYHHNTQSTSKHLGIDKVSGMFEEMKDDLVEKIIGYSGQRYSQTDIEPIVYSTENLDKLPDEIISFASKIEEWAENNKYSDVINLSQELGGIGAKLKYLLTLNDTNESLKKKTKINEDSDYNIDLKDIKSIVDKVVNKSNLKEKESVNSYSLSNGDKFFLSFDIFSKDNEYWSNHVYVVMIMKDELSSTSLADPRLAYQNTSARIVKHKKKTKREYIELGNLEKKLKSYLKGSKYLKSEPTNENKFPNPKKLTKEDVENLLGLPKGMRIEIKSGERSDYTDELYKNYTKVIILPEEGKENPLKGKRDEVIKKANDLKGEIAIFSHAQPNFGGGVSWTLKYGDEELNEEFSEEEKNKDLVGFLNRDIYSVPGRKESDKKYLTDKKEEDGVRNKIFGRKGETIHLYKEEEKFDGWYNVHKYKQGGDGIASGILTKYINKDWIDKELNESQKWEDDQKALDQVLPLLKELHGLRKDLKITTEDVNGAWNIVFNDEEGISTDLIDRFLKTHTANTMFDKSTLRVPNRYYKGKTINIHFDNDGQKYLDIKNFAKDDWNPGPPKIKNVSEAEEAEEKTEPDSKKDSPEPKGLVNIDDDEIKSLIDDEDYERFISRLIELDPKIVAFLKTGLDKVTNGKYKAVQKSLPVSTLIPTQNEIDVDKSLKRSLTDPKNAEVILTTNEISIGGKDIVSFNSKYIIDGHHRWSQIYPINPKASITAEDLQKSGKNAKEVLKDTQLVIKLLSGTVPVSKVEGKNLLTIGEKDLKEYVTNTITDEVLAVFNKELKLDTKEKVADYIWDNVSKMQESNKPIVNAPGRGLMPQTDAVEGGSKKVVQSLEKGKIEESRKLWEEERKKTEKKEKSFYDINKIESKDAKRVDSKEITSVLHKTFEKRITNISASSSYPDYASFCFEIKDLNFEDDWKLLVDAVSPIIEKNGWNGSTVIMWNINGEWNTAITLCYKIINSGSGGILKDKGNFSDVTEEKDLFEDLLKDETHTVTDFKLKDKLNPAIWDGDEIKDNVETDLIILAKEFWKSLNLKSELKDIIVVGSNANYNYTEFSDIDLHLITNFSDISDDEEMVKDYLDGKRWIWNKMHNVKIEGYDVEIYIQNEDEENAATGVYSLLKDEWVKKPNPEEVEIDQSLVSIKSSAIKSEIDTSITEAESIGINDKEKLDLAYRGLKELLKSKVTKMRKDSLATGGEFSVENLVFKELRNSGYIEKLIKATNEVYDKIFSIE